MGPTMLERYIASMVLGGVGDAMGFKNAGWEFNQLGENIHKELKKLGGVERLHIKLPNWRVSDDTVMQLATGDGLVAHGTSDDKEALYLKIARYYKDCMQDMRLRSAGNTCRGHAYALQPQKPKGYQQPFDSRSGGCGAAMRAMCIGLRYPREEDLDDLISCSVESGRMTHHHPTGYLGALAAALFTSYSLQDKPVREWGAGLMETLPKAKKYIEEQGRFVMENVQAWSYFHDHWVDYLKERHITDGQSDPKFPKRYGVKERDAFYKSVSFSGWGGASGHDAPMIAYDALLGSGDSWVELCHRGVLHGGDNDSTGTIVGACFGAMFGFQGVPEINYKDLEYRDRLITMGVELYKLSHPGEPIPSNCLESVCINLPAEYLSDSEPKAKENTSQDSKPDSSVSEEKDQASTDAQDSKDADAAQSSAAGDSKTVVVTSDGNDNPDTPKAADSNPAEESSEATVTKESDSGSANDTQGQKDNVDAET